MSAGWMSEKSALIGRCAACRFSRGDLGGLVCVRFFDVRGGESVRAVWSCEFFEYEPGAVE